MHAISIVPISNETRYLSIAQGVLSVMCGPPSTKSCAHLASPSAGLSCTPLLQDITHRIRLWENLQESPIFDSKNHGFL